MKKYSDKTVKSGKPEYSVKASPSIDVRQRQNRELVKNAFRQVGTKIDQNEPYHVKKVVIKTSSENPLKLRAKPNLIRKVMRQ